MSDGLLEMLRDAGELPKEPLLYEVGGLIFAFALMGFGHTTRRLLHVIGRRGIWLLPYAGAILMLVVVGLHNYGSYAYGVMLERGIGNAETLLRLHQLRFAALLAMVASSALTLAGAVVLWFWLTGSRLTHRRESRPPEEVPEASG